VNDTLTVRAVAGRLKTTPETTRRLIKSGDIKAFRLSGDQGPWRVTEEALAAYIERRTETRSDPWKRTRPRRSSAA
jgi:excisionase family DNA binding protein